jgi:glutaminyl-tRNA synthetase
MPGADRKVKGTIHWVSAKHAVATEVRLYDRLFGVPAPDSEDEGKSWLEHVNPQAKRVVQAWLEPAAAGVDPEQRFQFERLGYFVADRVDHRADAPVFNRTVTLRDAWTRQAGQ